MTSTPDAGEPDARRRALMRGEVIAQQDLIAAGGALSLAQVQRLLAGASQQRVEQMVADHCLLAVPSPGGGQGYPAFQFLDDGSVVPGLKRVVTALPTKSPWGILNFLVHPDFRLNERRPIDLLKAGDIGLVVEAAAAVDTQG